MSFFGHALNAEAAGDKLSALQAYEQALAEPAPPLEAFTNLAFLYWSIDWDYGVQTHFLQAYQLPDTAVVDFGQRWRRVLAHAIAWFPDEPEPVYWQGYFTAESTYANAPDAFLLALPARWPGFDLPYLYRYQNGCQGEVEWEALRRLHARYRPDITHKGTFITNTIEAIWRFGL